MIVTLKPEYNSDCYDQQPFSITLRNETSEAWIGWPQTWLDGRFGPATDEEIYQNLLGSNQLVKGRMRAWRGK